MDIRIVNPTQYEGWDEQIARLPGCTFFHSAAWARVLIDSYGYRPVYVVALDGGTISACLPVMEVNSFLTGRRGVSLPFTDCCDPLVSNPEQFNELMSRAVDQGKQRNWKSLELRGGEKFLDGSPVSSSYLLHTLDLNPESLCGSVGYCANQQPTTNNQQPASVDLQPATRNSQQSLVPNQPAVSHSTLNTQHSTRSSLVFSSFRPSTQRNIRNATARGVTVEIRTSEESLRQFYRLNQLTRRDHGLPPQPYRFFEEVYNHVISKGNGFVAVAFHKDAAIAASVYFHFGKTALYKYGASDKAFQHLRANNLVMWEAIDWYARNGYRSLSFGRTDLDHDGLRQFKMGWGVAEQPLRYYQYSLKTNAFVANGSEKSRTPGSKAASIVPLPVLRAVGSLLYRHMG